MDPIIQVVESYYTTFFSRKNTKNQKEREKKKSKFLGSCSCGRIRHWYLKQRHSLTDDQCQTSCGILLSIWKSNKAFPILLKILWPKRPKIIIDICNCIAITTFIEFVLELTVIYIFYFGFIVKHNSYGKDMTTVHGFLM